MTTDPTTNIPAWLNLDAIVPAGAADTLAHTEREAIALLLAVCEFTTNHVPIIAAIEGEISAQVPDYFDEVHHLAYRHCGLDRIDDVLILIATIAGRMGLEVTMDWSQAMEAADRSLDTLSATQVHAALEVNRHVAGSAASNGEADR